jgi:ribA/ribD-fused uncharacterized protein
MTQEHPPTSLEALRQYLEAGHRPHYLYFWGHRPRADGRLSASCFSQWSEFPFTVDDISYPTAEHFMMAEKARLFQDKEIEAEIIQSSSPGEAKGLGRRIKGFSEDVWRDSRFQIVVRGNYAKFSQHPELMGYLLATHNAVLVEASPTDRIWGIGLAKTDPRAQSPHQWQGLNLLGFALMEVRLQLASGGAS